MEPSLGTLNLLFMAICMLVQQETFADCMLGGHNFSAVDGLPWIVESVNDKSNVTYKLSLCKELSTSQHARDCPQHTAVCRYAGTNNVTSIGNLTSPPDVTVDGAKGELWLRMQGSPCLGSPQNFTKTIVNFKCGKTLGSPRFLRAHACETYFEWHTSAACKAPPSLTEVKCYVYDSGGHKRDLTPLIKLKGGHRVGSESGEDFFINVCREITPEGSTSTCPANSSACAISNGVAVDRGHPAGQLTITSDDKLLLQYRSTTTPAGCDNPATTSITFLCPERGMSHRPLLFSNLDCHYDIEWRTEYACKEELLVSTTCGLTNSQHGIDLDLTPLRKDKNAESRYKLTVPSGGKNYTYFVNICGEIGIGCPDDAHKEGVAACQLNLQDASFGKVMGRSSQQILRYSDGELTLTYRGGERCSSHFQRETVINFHCDRNAAGDGVGSPVFNSEDMCTYLFDWPTKYACLATPLSGQCRVSHGKHSIDLAALHRTDQDGNWEALRSQHINGETDNDRYFINVCQDVLRIGGASGCPVGAAVCRRDGSGVAQSLGSFASGPVYDASTQSVHLHYTRGGQCSGNKKTKETEITFRCKPGDLSSGPSLVEVTSDGCLYKFEWGTAAACVAGVAAGDNCQVTDSEGGYSFDLSSLMKTGTRAFYKLSPTGSSHDYYINVCAKISGTPCDTAGKDNVGVCQVTRANEKQLFSTGQPSSVLNYYNGMINLTYTGGDMYVTTPPVARTTEIAFLCDPKAGVGVPEFDHEANHTYNFRWFTALSCPRVPVECTVTDDKTGKQYDLSSLGLKSDQGNWNAMDNSAADSLKQRKFYLNLCRPINHVKVGQGCDPSAAVCMSHFENGQESVIVTNLGRALLRPTVEGNGDVLITYTHGIPCRKMDGSNGTYSTKIHLRCHRGLLTSAPHFLLEEDCEFAFLWETAEACPLTDTDTDTKLTTDVPCTVKDPNSDFIFNLKPLMKKSSEAAYVVKNPAGTRTFKFNVCGPVHEAGCGSVGQEAAGICEGSTSLARSSSILHLSPTGLIFLIYEGERLSNGNVQKVKIFFTCNQTVIKGTPRVSQEVDGLELTIETALACHPQPVDCVVTDNQGREYDLSPLARVESNWAAVDTKHHDLKYYISVCRPLKPVTGATCHGGPVGGCQVGAGSSFSLGYIQSQPIAGQDGSLSLRYLNGDSCHHGAYHRSMRIIFECSDVHHEPTFYEETEDCEYIFMWQTPNACPLKRVTGDNCRVTEPLYHMTFDLSQLQKLGERDYTVKAGEYVYELNVCRTLNAGQGVCAGDLGVGACQTKTTSTGTSRINAGKSNQKLVYDDGEITLTYKEGKGSCHKKYERRTIITFVCNHENIGLKGPVFLNETEKCTYLFEWQTSYVCMPLQLADCAISDSQGQNYDLSQLTLTHDNYVVMDTRKKYLLNVCTTIVHQKGVTCPPSSAACMIDLTQTDPKHRFVKLGEPGGRLLKFDEHGNLELTYTGGHNCSDNTRQSSTVITFICRKDAVASSPQLELVEAGCVYKFTWITEKACPLAPPTSGGGNCTVTNPATGYTYNLSGLQRSDGYTTNDGRGHRLDLNVCAPLRNSVCEGQPGACQVEEFGTAPRNWNAGKTNSDLQLVDRALVLNYSSGALCHHSNSTRTTLITFVCAKSGTGLGQPVFIDEDDCNYFVSWHTELACEKQVKCVVEDDHGNVLDLSPLVRGSGFHLAINTAGQTDPGAAFYLNVCRPLNPIRGTLCPPQASACRVKLGEKPQSLGRVGPAPFFEQYSRSVMLVYDHGTPCESNGHKTNSTSKIMFVCQAGENQGQPKLLALTADCSYTFEWPTNVVCPEADPVYTSDCVFTDSRVKHSYDLTSLRKKPGNPMDYKVVTSGGTFYINMCGPVVSSTAIAAGCGHSAVCFVSQGGSTEIYGSSLSAKRFQMEGENLKVQYTGSTACPRQSSRNASAYFLFECNTDVKGHGSPAMFSSDEDCDVVFTWKTPLACRPVVKDCTLAEDGATYDLQPLSRETGSWTLTDANGNKYWLNLCQGVHGAPISPDCPPNAVACRITQKGAVDMLGIVQSQKMHVAADGKSIIAEYSHGTDACNQRQDNGEPMLARIRITFKCAGTLGGPVLIPRKGDTGSCTYEFEWKSRVACKEQRTEVVEDKGVIVDPRSGGNLDFYKLQHQGSHEVVAADGQTKFLVNLNGTAQLGTATDGAARCVGAVVCQTEPRLANQYQSLGNANKRKLYMEDGILEAVYTSRTVCDSNSGRMAKTVIVFHCQEFGSNNMGPKFVDRSRNCEYLFDWFTPHVCISLTGATGGRQPPGGSTAVDGSQSGGHHTQAGLVVGVLAAVLIVCVLAGVLYKPDRRAAVARRLRRVFCRGVGRSSIRYSALSSPDEEALLVSDSRQDWGTRDTSLPSFHDDSDEDLVL